MSERFTQADVDANNAKRLPKVAQPEDAYDGPERDLHDRIEEELIHRRWYYVHSRTDRPTTQTFGVTDFIIAAGTKSVFDKHVFYGRTFWIEVKRKGSKLTKEQNITRHVLTALGHRWACVYSYEEFLNVIGPS